MNPSHPHPARPDWSVVSRVSADFASLSRQMAQMSSDLTALHTTMTAVPTPTQHQAPVQHQAPARQHPMPQHPMPQPPVPPRPPVPTGQGLPQWAAPGFAVPPRPVPPPASPGPGLLRRAASAADGRLVGTVLAVAGVAVTLVGVVLLLVLAAQAGILRPEVRVGAGALLAGVLVAAACRLHRRTGGRVGALALAATGVATAYLDVIAVTRIYEWLPAAGGLVMAAVVGGLGLGLARRWDAQYLALGVLVPLIALAPFVTGGITLHLIGFMLALAVVAVPVHLGTDWLWLHMVRVDGGTVWLFVAVVLSASTIGDGVSTSDGWLLVGAAAVNAAVTLASTIAMLPRLRAHVAVAATSVVGMVPLLLSGMAVDHRLAGAAIGGLALTLLALVVIAPRLSSIPRVVRDGWAVLSAVSALIAVVSASAATVVVPALLGLALTTTVLARHHVVGRWIGLVFAAVGGLAFAAQSPVADLVDPVRIGDAEAVSTVVAGLVLAATAGAVAWVWTRSGAPAAAAQWPWAITGVVALYAITSVAVTTGVAAGGTSTGFLGGHLAATICWIAAAAVALTHASRVPAGPARLLPLGGGMALAAAAVGKVFLFDLATLDGAFRVGAFIVVGLALLVLGARYARTTAPVR